MTGGSPETTSGGAALEVGAWLAGYRDAKGFRQHDPDGAREYLAAQMASRAVQTIVVEVGDEFDGDGHGRIDEPRHHDTTLEHFIT